MVDFKFLLRDPSASLHSNLQRWLMLDKVLMLLHGRKEFADDFESKKLSKFKAVLKEDIERKLKYLTEVAQNRMNKDTMIKNAGTRLTKTFGLKIRAFYELFVKKINDRIDRINTKNLYSQTWFIIIFKQYHRQAMSSTQAQNNVQPWQKRKPCCMSAKVVRDKCIKLHGEQ